MNEENEKGNVFCSGCKHCFVEFDGDTQDEKCRLKYFEKQDAISKHKKYRKCDDINFMNDCSLRESGIIEKILMYFGMRPNDIT